MFSQQLYVWVGKDANEEEKSGSLKIGKTNTAIIERRRNYIRDFVHICILVFLSAQDYINSDPSGRRGIPISTIKQGEEPLSFTGWFHAWDPKMWEKDLLACLQARIKGR